MANKPADAVQNLCMPERPNYPFPSPFPSQRSMGLERFPAHVVDLIGPDLPWGSWGAIAIQSYRTQPFVYFIGGDVGLVKIGQSVAPLERLATMQMGSPVELSILALTPGAAALEREYHSRFASARRRGEWFARTPEIVAEIARLTQGYSA